MVTVLLPVLPTVTPLGREEVSMVISNCSSLSNTLSLTTETPTEAAVFPAGKITLYVLEI